MSPIYWIVFFGVRGSGKSTLGEYLAQNFEFTVDAFANPLKKAAQVIFGFTNEDLYGSSENRETQYHAFLNTGWCHGCYTQCVFETNPLMPQGLKHPLYSHPWWCPKCESQYPRYVNPRHALKTLGTEWGRALCLDIWIQALFQAHRGTTKRLVVTDGRFINENYACQAHGCLRVLLTRGLAESTDPHPSEAEVREQAKDRETYFDVVLDNADQSLEETKVQLYATVSNLIGD